MTEQTHDVTIVGAGMAGMTAALHLLKAGFTVKVVEASEANNCAEASSIVTIQ